MTEQEKQQTDVKTFTQEDIDKLTADLTAKHQEEMDKLAGKMRAEFKEKEAKAKAEAEKAARQANMTELEKANETIKELESKYQEQADINALASQKDETRKVMSEMGVDISNLEFCFVPKDMEATKAKVKAFKEMIDGVKKSTFENGLKSTVPNKGKADPEATGLRQAFGLK